MADSDKPKTEGRPESPTTARELDFDDDEPQTPAKDATHAAAAQSKSESTPSAPGSNAGAPAAAPPAAQPPHALSPREQAELTLSEAFPTIDGSVVKAVLAASGYQVEPAFNALLGMTDPSSQVEPAPVAAPPPPRPPQQPPRPKGPPAAPDAKSGGAKSQLEADELYARQLAEHYQRQDARAMAREQGGYTRQGRGQQYPEERERNFIDDDLPEIGENIRKGFLETQKTFNGWFNTLKKKIDGDEEEEEPPKLPARRGETSYPAGRRSDDYDADPEEFGNDFARIQLRDDTGPPKQPPRRANPNLFKPTPSVPQEGRRVSFQSGPPEEIRSSPNPTKQQNSKWQPLSKVEPTPAGDHDPFSLGDSDEEDPKKKDQKNSKSLEDTKSEKKDNADLLKKATAEAMADDIGDEPSNKLELKDNTESGGNSK